MMDLRKKNRMSKGQIVGQNVKFEFIRAHGWLMNGSLLSRTENLEKQSGLCVQNSPLHPPLSAHMGETAV